MYKIDEHGKRKLAVELPAHLVELKQSQSAARQNITIFSSPITTVYNFVIVAFETLVWLTTRISTHSVTKFLLLPIVFFWACGSMIEGSHQEYCRLLEKAVEVFVWWVGLGVLSSVGLGTGMHSGILFLFPHIMRVCSAAHSCNNVAFDSLADMWFRDTTAAFACTATPSAPAVTFVELFVKVFLPCMLWGAGTAMGEIPPYAVSRAARLAGERNAEFEDLDLDNPNPSGLVDKMKVWMVTFLQKYGFWGVVLFSAWPNALFDLCGICCGHFLMPFWSFFGATFIGKALIKVNGQAAVLIMIFSPSHLSMMLSVLEPVMPANLYAMITKAITSANSKFSGAAAVDDDAGKGILAIAWGYIMLLLIGWFALSCVTQFAQAKQAEKDEAEIESLLIQHRESHKKSS